MAGPLKNARQEAFAQGIAVGGLTLEAAYAKAGYKPCRKAASRLRKTEAVQERIIELLNRSAERTGVTLDRVLERYAEIAFAGMSKFLRISPDGDPIIDLSKCSEAELDLLAETTTEDFSEGRGEDSRNVRRVKIKMLDTMKALEALGKHLGMGDKARNETTDRLTEALMQINARGSAAPIATAARLSAQQQDGEADR